MTDASTTDQVVKIGNSQIQHGPFNDRVYIMKVDPADVDPLLQTVAEHVADGSYGKVFAKIPRALAARFAALGYQTEAVVPGYFQGEEDCLFMAQFHDEDRCKVEMQTIHEIIAAAAKRQPAQRPSPWSDHVFACTPEHAEQMAVLYDQVFDSYPFPINDPDYIRQTMASHVRYFGICDNDRLIALASSEIDHKALAVEMTDFATDPDYRGQKCASVLLSEMEQSMTAAGHRTAFTIARAVSWGMNFVFADAGYHFTGTLCNNTNIAGQLESMNVWYKPLDGRETDPIRR